MEERIKAVLRQTPGLRGSQIAKKIGANKKAVNSFLHANKDMFFQDSDFRWSVIDSSEVTVEFEEGIWIDCASFEGSLKSAGPLLDSPSQSVAFILPRKCRMLIVVAARFLALCNQLIDTGKKVTIDFSLCSSSLSYLDRAGFLDQLHKNIVIKPDRPRLSRASQYRGNSTALVEVGKVSPSSAEQNKNLIVSLIEAFVSQAGEGYRVFAGTIFGELIGNIPEHSNVTIPGFAALQRYEGKQKHIQTVVSDSGAGIAKTLRPSLEEHYPDLYNLYKHQNVDSDIGLVQEVLSKGKISRFGASRGLGFKSSSEYAKKFDAILSVRQERFSIDLIYRHGNLSNVIVEKNLMKICGTHVCFDFNC